MMHFEGKLYVVLKCFNHWKITNAFQHITLPTLLSTGDPQGSILSPLIFSYLQDLITQTFVKRLYFKLPRKSDTHIKNVFKSVEYLYLIRYINIHIYLSI